MTLVVDAKAVQLRSLLSETQQLSALIRDKSCAHLVANDVQAVEFMCKLHESGYDVAADDAVACAERLRMTVETGVYPRHLLTGENGKRQSA